MEKVDIAIGVVGLFALVATGLGVGFYDDINGLQDYLVIEDQTALEDQGPVAATNAIEQVFRWDAPHNTTGAAFNVTVVVTPGTPADMGTVNVVLRLRGPGGQDEVTTSGSMGVQDGSATFSIADSGWTNVPESFRSDDAGSRTHSWGDNITLVVIIDGPGGVLPLPGFPSASYQVSAGGDAMTYHAARELPDPQAGG